MNDCPPATTTNSSPTSSSSSNMPTPRQFTCVGCRGPIRDQYVFRVAPDMEWHANCLRCSDCRQLLDETCTCFVRDGQVYCKPDYIRLFGTKCAKCNESFGRNDLVMKAKSNVYHVTCFRCAVCCRQLVSGDEFSLREDAQLLCKTDHEAAYNNNNIPGSSIGIPCDDPCGDDVIVTASSADDAKHGGSDTSSSRSGAASPDLLRDGSPDLDFVVGVASSTASSGGDCGPPHRQGDKAALNGGGNFHRIHHGGRMIGRNHHHHHRGQDPHHKTTRIRTVLNEKQLHMLRTCYSANSRPDALMKEQLVEMTGLSPRVIRVWFQNKRCKDKKRSIALKQLQQQQQNKVDGCHLEGSWIHKGVPLIATSPVRHEPSVNFLPTPVEVHKFPGVPWSIDLVAQHQQHAGRDSPGTADLEALAPGSPEPLSPACDLTRPGSNQILRGLAAVHQCANGADSLLLHAGSSLVQSQSLAGESFDDDTVVSFDDLSDVMSCGGASQGVPAGCSINQLTNGATIRPPTDGVSGSRNRNDENTPILLQQQQQQTATTYGTLDGLSF